MKRHPHAESEARAAVQVAESMVERRALKNVDLLEQIRWPKPEFESWRRDSQNACFVDVATLLIAAVDALAAEADTGPEMKPYPPPRDSEYSTSDGEEATQALLPSMVAEYRGTATDEDIENPAQILLGFTSRLLQCLMETGNLSWEELDDWWREFQLLRALKQGPSSSQITL